MTGLDDIKVKIAQMSKIPLEMWRLTFRVFMEQDTDLILQILEKESGLNKLEEQLTSELITLGRSSGKSEKSIITVYADIVGDLEIIGDYCKDILERVQIKIEEKLLFSDDAVKEYSDLYRKTEKAMEDLAFALEKEDYCLLKRLLKNDKEIDKLVNEYRGRHNQRLIEGVCTPFACNMFLNMLDFTASVYHHVDSIAEKLVRLEK
ncbi:MAG: PhoU domain-containing protein [Candidatus Omnitrophica bacterium]|nr:PhoU domain-containing protein [Candidatus Omnitrophota bacterium]MDD5552319.1 PhoU domain-containing protein [Candidatus Omnitrophota bacterium]